MLKMGFGDTYRGCFREHGLLTLPGIYIMECLMFHFKNKQLFSNAQFDHLYNTRGRLNSLVVPRHRLTDGEESKEQIDYLLYLHIIRNI